MWQKSSHVVLTKLFIILRIDDKNFFNFKNGIGIEGQKGMQTN